MCVCVLCADPSLVFVCVGMCCSWVGRACRSSPIARGSRDNSYSRYTHISTPLLLSVYSRVDKYQTPLSPHIYAVALCHPHTYFYIHPPQSSAPTSYPLPQPLPFFSAYRTTATTTTACTWSTTASCPMSTPTTVHDSHCHYSTAHGTLTTGTSRISSRYSWGERERDE
jgi:hypothetical protein